MNSYIISYELVGVVNHIFLQNLHGAIKSYGTWAHITDSCWAIKTAASAIAVRDHLHGFMRHGDRLIVVQTAHIAAWNNTMCDSNWLQENI